MKTLLTAIFAVAMLIATPAFALTGGSDALLLAVFNAGDTEHCYSGGDRLSRAECASTLTDAEKIDEMRTGDDNDRDAEGDDDI